MSYWEAASIAVDGPVAATVMGRNRHYDAPSHARAARFAEERGVSFEDTAFGDLRKAPLMERPSTTDLLPLRRLDVVLLRTITQREKKSAFLAGTDIGARAKSPATRGGRGWSATVLKAGVIAFSDSWRSPPAGFFGSRNLMEQPAYSGISMR